MLGMPLKFLHIYAGSYLASLLLIVGALFLLLNWKAAKANFSISVAQKIAALILGFATILAFGAWLNWQLDDAWLNAPRWLRFAGLLPILLDFLLRRRSGARPGGRRGSSERFVSRFTSCCAWNYGSPAPSRHTVSRAGRFSSSFCSPSF